MDRLRRWTRSVREVVVEVVREFGDDGVMDLAAGVAFFTAFSIPAAALALTAFLGVGESFFGADLQTTVRDNVLEFVADEISANEDFLTAVSSLFDADNSGLFTFAVVLALYSMSRGFAGLVKALDAVYDLDDERSWLSVRLTAVLLAVGTVTMITLALVLTVIGPLFGAGEDIAADLGLGDTWAQLWNRARQPFLFVVLVLWAALVFHVGPDHRTPWRWDLPGAVVTAVGWIGLSLGFGVYVDLTGGGNQVVGVIGTLLVALTWLHFMIVSLLVGGELNAVIAQRAGISVQHEGDVGFAVTGTLKRLVTERIGNGDGDGTATVATMTARTETITGPDGSFAGHLVVPDSGSGPGIVLIQEIFGVNAYIRAVAERLAGEGYVVLAPDMFWRIQPGTDIDSSSQDAIGPAMEIAGQFDPAGGVADLDATLAHLRGLDEVTGPVGVIGFCFGGTQALVTAIEHDPACAVSYYGSGVASLLDRADEATCPMLFHFGGDDPFLPLADAEATRDTFASRPDVEVVIHEGAGHAFDNHLAPHFSDEAAAAAAWATTSDFLARHLKG